MRTLRASSVVLEPQRVEHANEMFEVLSDLAIYEFENRPPISKAILAERYAKLEARQSPDGQEKWLNWVLRVPSGELVGYVQATVLPSGSALVGYELNSMYWRQGLGSAALKLVLRELEANYSAYSFAAVLKSSNYRSSALLRKLGFEPASYGETKRFGSGPDEVVMVKLINDKPDHCI